MGQEGRWPKSGSCPLLAGHYKWPRMFCRPSVSPFFLRRLEQHTHGTRPRRPWLKWLIVVDVQQQILLAQRARQGPGCDARSLPGLLDVAARGAALGVVLADAEFDSEANHAHIRQRLGAK